MCKYCHAYCLEEGCMRRAYYNVKESKTPYYCCLHKKDNMVDVSRRRCKKCDTIPSFNKPGKKKAIYCSTHKKPGMVDVRSKRCCECTNFAVYNTPDKKSPLFCSLHRKTGMTNVRDYTCKSEWCETIANPKINDGYCRFCFVNLFPDKPVARNYKTKERTIVDHIKTKFPDLSWVSDKQINDGCSKRRPDMLLDLGYQVLIIEIDENQHTQYDCSCENKRIMELSQDVNHRPIVFIRFNPDDYLQDNKKITSCWGLDKNGLCVLKKSKEEEWNKRLKSLEQIIIYWKNPSNVTDKTIETVQLFYDI